MREVPVGIMLGLPVVVSLSMGLTTLFGGCDRSGDAQGAKYGEGDAPQREVVVYVSADEAIARPILEEFARESGISVRARYDGEASKTAALVAMLRQERDSPRADVFWSSECFAASELALEGLVASWRSRRSDSLPEALRGEAGRWYGFAPRMRVLVFDPARTSPGNVPQTMIDLAVPHLNGRVAIADPRFGTTRGHIGAFAAMIERDSPGAFVEWVGGFAARRPLVLSGGNAAVVDAVTRGEAAFGLTDSDDYFAAISQGASLAVVPIRQFDPSREGGGAMLIPNTVSLVAGAPHPAEAGELMDFLLGGSVSRWLHESRSGNLVIPEIAALDGAGVAALPQLPSGIPKMPQSCADSPGYQAIESARDPFIYDASAGRGSIDESVAALRAACAKEASR